MTILMTPRVSAYWKGESIPAAVGKLPIHDEILEAQ